MSISRLQQSSIGASHILVMLTEGPINCCAMKSGSGRYIFAGIHVYVDPYSVIWSPLQNYCHTWGWLTPSARLQERLNSTEWTRVDAQDCLLSMRFTQGYHEASSFGIVLGEN